jgi:hypothetical protein
MGAKFRRFGCVALSPLGTPPFCPFRIGARYFGMSRLEEKRPVSMLCDKPAFTVRLCDTFHVSENQGCVRQLTLP